ncbi:FAD-binding oxidoreductase [Candidatus Saccharibacteria bacterium]|nr:FAD-binding oxidoreductase [Candidatus Saccharibacteria bacterium]
MSKVAHYLQEHLLGEVSISPDARRHFSTDNSIFSITPSIIVYPRNEHDVRKTARFAWQLAERGRIIPITARGAGTDFSGGSLGQGIILAFPAHMNRIVVLDQKTGSVVVEPGLNYGRLQQTLHTHERFLPPYPSSLEYSTLGGAVGNNAAGEKSVKYGPTSTYTRSLRVVLSNGEVIETRRLSKRELNKKLGLSTFEGEVYRQLDTLIEENRQTLDRLDLNIARNTAGYNLNTVKHSDGSFDLTPLFVGSQGTLGIISEITLDTEPFNPETVLFTAAFETYEAATEAILALRKLTLMPSTIEMVDRTLLKIVDSLNPNQLRTSVKKPYPRVMLLVEFDDSTERIRRKSAKKTKEIFEKLAISFEQTTDKSEQDRMWKIRHASANLLSHSEQQNKAIPAIEDAIVPVDRLPELFEKVQQLSTAVHQPIAMWGHAGEGNVHLHPYFDLSKLGDKQTMFKLWQEYYSTVKELGGSTSASYNDGRIRSAYLANLYGEEVVDIFRKIKKIFDPYAIMNPGVKIDASLETLKPNIRGHYSLEHLYNHMPRS